MLLSATSAAEEEREVTALPRSGFEEMCVRVLE
jgi:hypothetical protein